MFFQRISFWQFYFRKFFRHIAHGIDGTFKITCHFCHHIDNPLLVFSGNTSVFRALLYFYKICQRYSFSLPANHFQSKYIVYATFILLRQLQHDTYLVDTRRFVQYADRHSRQCSSHRFRNLHRRNSSLHRTVFIHFELIFHLQTFHRPVHIHDIRSHSQ